MQSVYWLKFYLISWNSTEENWKEPDSDRITTQQGNLLIHVVCATGYSFLSTRLPVIVQYMRQEHSNTHPPDFQKAWLSMNAQLTSKVTKNVVTLSIGIIFMALSSCSLLMEDKKKALGNLIL